MALWISVYIQNDMYVHILCCVYTRKSVGYYPDCWRRPMSYLYVRIVTRIQLRADICQIKTPEKVCVQPLPVPELPQIQLTAAPRMLCRPNIVPKSTLSPPYSQPCSIRVHSFTTNSFSMGFCLYF